MHARVRRTPWPVESDGLRGGVALMARRRRRLNQTAASSQPARYGFCLLYVAFSSAASARIELARLPLEPLQPLLARYALLDLKSGQLAAKARVTYSRGRKPELVARCVCELIDQTSPPPRITVGDAFQTKIAPLIFRFLPQRVRLWGLKRYYGI